MTLNDFFLQLVKEYKKASHLVFDCQNANVFRGRQHSVSSIAEDLFAVMLAGTLTHEFKHEMNLYFMVDYPMHPDNKGSRMYPDIAVIAEATSPVLVSYLDLKTDLGFKREYFNTLPSIGEAVDRLHRAKFTGTRTWSPDKKKEKQIQISNAIIWRTVVLATDNLGGFLEENKIRAKAQHEDFELYFLSNGKHPNHKKFEDINPDADEYQRLLDDIRNDIKNARPQIFADESTY